MRQQRDHVLGMQDAFDVVEVAVEYGHARVPFLGEKIDGLLRRRVDRDAYDARARHHDLLRRPLGEREEPVDQLRRRCSRTASARFLAEDLLDLLQWWSRRGVPRGR